MAEIRILDSGTIDKIAAGEVVERPASVVKELTENAVDAGSFAVTVEIKEGGISFIRVTDNGCGIEASQVRHAFLRHATSKIASAEDLRSIKSLGFRGEALSSISAVAKVELITKTRDALTGIRYLSEGADEKEFSEVGAPDGTTIMVRNLFFNTPVRRKFLKQPQTEGSYIIDLMEHMALSRPDVSFKLIVNGRVRFHTSGNGDLKEIIYRIYGREVADNLIAIQKEISGIAVSGYLGKPVLNRSNRNFENYDINGRYIKSSLLAKAIEDGYSQYLMQHKFPFTVLHFTVDTELVDVNVHPTKMDVRFTEGNKIYDFVADAVAEALRAREMIPEAVFTEKSNVPKAAAEPMAAVLGLEAPKEKSAVLPAEEKSTSPEKLVIAGEKSSIPEPFEEKRIKQFRVMEEMAYEAEKQPAVQRNLFEEKLFSKENREEYKILGQIFDTYWLIAFQDKLFIADQHAAHEKVKYERLVRHFRDKEIVSQSLNPPIVVTLSAKEEQVFSEHREVFANLGFEIENFGGSEYALRGVPADLYGCDEKALFLEVLDELALGPSHKNLTVVEEKLASMACKAAVKGNHSLNAAEMEALLDELLTLENPYNCPHGRPTIISMSKYEIEKKFKRIV